MKASDRRPGTSSSPGRSARRAASPWSGRTTRSAARTPRPHAPRRPDTRAAVFQAAAIAFSARGFDGVGVDDIAERAKVNKAMIYYHFADKLALYREVVRDTFRAVGATVAQIADTDLPPPAKLDLFIRNVVQLADDRPWFPTLMLREMAEGAPHLDIKTLGLMRTVFLAFGRIVSEGQAAGVFGPVHPVLAYMSVVGPLMFNAARERVAAQPGRAHLPMLAKVSHTELINHMQHAAQRMLARDPVAASSPRRRHLTPDN